MCFFFFLSLSRATDTRHPRDLESTRWSAANLCLLDHEHPSRRAFRHMCLHGGNGVPASHGPLHVQPHAHTPVSRSRSVPTYAFKPEPHVFSFTILRVARGQQVPRSRVTCHHVHRTRLIAGRAAVMSAWLLLSLRSTTVNYTRGEERSYARADHTHTSITHEKKTCVRV